MFHHKIIDLLRPDFTNLFHLVVFVLNVLQRAFDGDGIRILDDDQRRVGTVVRMHQCLLGCGWLEQTQGKYFLRKE